jgi:DNA-binding transcriptional MerR regulator
MYIGELARRTGIPTKTIRYYEQIGILPKVSRTPSGFRDYEEDALDRLEFIKKAKDLGLTLADIREIFHVRDHGTSPCPYVVHLLDHKIEELARRISGMQTLRDELAKVRRRASTLPPEEIAARARFCHIIENRALTAQRPGPVIPLRPV